MMSFLSDSYPSRAMLNQARSPFFENEGCVSYPIRPSVRFTVVPFSRSYSNKSVLVLRAYSVPVFCLVTYTIFLLSGLHVKSSSPPKGFVGQSNNCPAIISLPSPGFPFVNGCTNKWLY